MQHLQVRLAFALALTARLAMGGAPAHAQIVLPGTQPGTLVNWPLEFTDPSNAVRGMLPRDCKTCHGGYIAGLDYEPFDTWAGTMMANSARDPLFWAALDVANQDHAGVGEFCIRCHSPAGWLGGRSSVPNGSALTGYPDEPDNDFEGISCAFCHRAYEGPGGTPFKQNGQYYVDDGTPAAQPPRRGPYADAFAPHAFASSPYHMSSEFCAACHDLRNPLVELLDANGQPTGLQFPEQLTYSEWLQSAFPAEGEQCQTCHMPEVAGYACNSFNPFRSDISRHDFTGANTFVPAILRGLYGQLLNRTAAYTYTINQALSMLQTQAATLGITVPPQAVAGDSVAVTVRVTNNTGHKLPTGYPEGRRMWLSVVAKDVFGVPFFESGAYDGATATLVADAQLRVYEVRHGVQGQGPTFHLVLNNRIVKDNRIPPRGMVPDAQTAPVGADYVPLPGGQLPHWDDVTYAIPVPAGIAGPMRVTAMLRYQTTSREYVEFLRDENHSGPDPKDRGYPNAQSRGDKIYSYWSSYGQSAPVDMTSGSASIPVAQAPANVAALQAVPGHNRVVLSWIPGPPVAGVKVLRKLYNDYPEFGDPPAAVPPPADQVQLDHALANGWVQVYDGTGTSFVDASFTNATRAVAYYAAYTYSAAGIPAFGTAAARARATTYLLGDLGEVGVPQTYDGVVNGVHDLPVFSLAYGTHDGQPGFNPECDIGPTDNGTSRGVPLTDDAIDFGDLVTFALAFGTSDPGGPLLETVPTTVEKLAAGASAAAESPVYVTLGPPQLGADGELRIPIEVEGAAGRVKALHVGLTAGPRAVPTPGLVPGPALTEGPGRPFAQAYARDGELAADIALLGPGTRLGRDGLAATLILSSSAGFDLAAATAAIDVRDAAGAPLPAQLTLRGGDRPPPSRAAITVSPNIPNPFNPRTTLELTLAAPSDVDVAVYDLAGRRIKTLLRGHHEAGVHALVWDGTDELGRAVASGVYVARAEAAGRTALRRMALVR
jgi:hypothetical protein